MADELRGTERPKALGKVSKDAIKRRVAVESGDFWQRRRTEAPEWVFGVAITLAAAFWTRNMNGFEQTLASVGAGSVAWAITHAVRGARRRMRAERDMLAEEAQAATRVATEERQQRKEAERQLSAERSARELPEPEIGLGQIRLGGVTYWGVSVTNRGPNATFFASMRIATSNRWGANSVHDQWWNKSAGNRSEIRPGSQDVFLIGQIECDRFYQWELSLCEHDPNIRSNRVIGRHGWLPGNNPPPVADLDLTISGERDGATGLWHRRVLFGPQIAQFIDAAEDGHDRRQTLMEFVHLEHERHCALNQPEPPSPSDQSNGEPDQTRDGV